MKWISGKTHALSAHDWYIKYMGKAIDCLYDVMLKLEKDGRNKLDEQFMFNIFNLLKLKPLDEYVKYIFDFFLIQLLVTQVKNPWKVNQKGTVQPNLQIE